MVKEFLSCQRADTPAEDREEKESVFADTPFFMDREVFIYPECNKGEKIESDEYCNEVIHKSIIRT